MTALLQDLRFGIRMLAKSPGFTAVAVLTLALGIGANTAIFSLVSAVLLRPLSGVVHPDELVMLERIQKGFTGDDFSYPDYLDYRDHNRTFASLLADSPVALSFSNGTTARIPGSLVSGNYFSTLGVHSAFGRLIEPEDVLVAGEAPVVVLSYGFWQRTFGKDVSVVGRAIQLNGHAFTIVGVAAAGFEGARTGRSFDVWLPITTQPAANPNMSAGTLQNRASGWIEILGRLRPGTGPQEAQADLNVVAGELARAYPATNATRRVAVLRHVGMDSDDRASITRALGLLMAVVWLLLMIASSNVANLLLARAAGRRREIAIRLAIGSGRGRIVRQLLTEGLLLSMLAGGAGLVLAPWLVQLALVLQQQAFGLRSLNVALDGRVLAFALIVSIATGVLLGLAPAAVAWQGDIVPDLKEGALGASARRSPVQALLVVVQVALSLVLLVGAGLALRTLQKILAGDPGFNSGNRLLVWLDLSTQGYSDTAGRAFYAQLLGRVRALRGVQAASLAGTAPPEEWPGAISVFYEGQAPPPDVLRGREFELGLRVNIDVIAPGYFRTLGIPLLAGRDFSEGDRADEPRVGIISEALARHLWPGENALGKRLEAPFVNDTPQPPLEIVGVARDTLHRSLVAAPPLLLYLPRAQHYNPRATLVVHTLGDPLLLLPVIRGEIAAEDKNLPIVQAQTMAQHVAESLWQQRLSAGLIGLFGVLALALAAIGLYGVISQSVAQRTREIGIRVTLGAKRADILDLVLRQGLKLTMAGIALGLGVSLISTRAMKPLLYSVSAYDPLTVALACLVLAIAALIASYVPARRATQVDPMVALRCE